MPACILNYVHTVYIYFALSDTKINAHRITVSTDWQPKHSKQQENVRTNLLVTVSFKTKFLLIFLRIHTKLLNFTLFQGGVVV